MKVAYIYRKPQTLYFSIEKIFLQISSFLKDSISVNTVYMPHARLLPGSIWKNWKAIRSVEADIYHVTGDVHYMVLGLPKKKTILTIHDCVFLQNTKGLKRLVLKYLFLKWPVKHCTVITTISEKSKHEIVQYSGCDPDKVIVVPNPVGEHFYYSSDSADWDKPQLLFIGFTPNKNLERVISAIKDIPCHLVIVGSLSEQQKRLLADANISFEQLSGISEHALADMYAKSHILLFPSTYEGFGLPIIEGQKSGRPVITSNISPMKEVAGEGACLVDPMDIASIKAGILKVIQDSEYRRYIIEKGLENVSHFEPVFIADQYLQIYKNIITKRKN
jgi:glycosyltransferase involved in cell wall biosynthesis